MSDWISLTEAAYDLSGDQHSWLERLVGEALPLFEHGDAAAGQVIRNADDIVAEDIVVLGNPELVGHVKRSLAASTLSEAVFSHVPGAEEAFVAANQGRYRDTLGIVCYTGVGRVVALNVPLAAISVMTARERRLWTQTAAHIGAGLRLRYQLSSQGLDTAPGVEAILSPEGRLYDAFGPAQKPSARERLRYAVKGFVRARTRLRREDPEQALSLWEGLVDGRWWIVLILTAVVSSWRSGMIPRWAIRAV